MAAICSSKVVKNWGRERGVGSGGGRNCRLEGGRFGEQSAQHLSSDPTGSPRAARGRYEKRRAHSNTGKAEGQGEGRGSGEGAVADRPWVELIDAGRVEQGSTRSRVGTGAGRAKSGRRGRGAGTAGPREVLRGRWPAGESERARPAAGAAPVRPVLPTQPTAPRDSQRPGGPPPDVLHFLRRQACLGG